MVWRPLLPPSLSSTNLETSAEFSTSNFLGIATRKDPSAVPKLVVPTSPSILASVTTKAIIEIASSLGYEIERRVIPFAEVVAGGFEEVCACGTAAVRSLPPSYFVELTFCRSSQAITPIRSISYNSSPETLEKVVIGNGQTAGPGFLAILSELTGIQSGVRPDTFGWTWPSEGVDGTS